MKSPKGFTLIELLIVIAILGVLAAAVLVVIDPVEQLARGRDAGRISSVEQLGKAIESYTVLQGGGSYPNPVATWQTTYLIATGEIKSKTTTPAISAIGQEGNGTCQTTNNEGNYCYSRFQDTGNGNVTTGIVWTLLESKSNEKKAGCSIPAIAYIGTYGRAGLVCLGWQGSGIPSSWTPPIPPF